MHAANSNATCQPALHQIAGVLTIEMRQFTQAVARRLMLEFPVVKRWHETEDICQEAAIRLQNALLATEPKSRRHLENLTALQIRRTLIDMARKYRRTLDQGPLRWTPCHANAEVDGQLEKSASQESDADSLELWTQLHASVDTMPSALKEVFQLVWYVGHSKKEVAEIVGSDIRTVQRRWRAAREYLTDNMNNISMCR